MVEHWVVVPDTRVQFPLATPLVLFLFFIVEVFVLSNDRTIPSSHPLKNKSNGLFVSVL